MRTTRIVLNLLLSLLMTFFGAVAAFSQATDGNILGTVRDPSGAVVAGANVELENVATGVKSETTSNADGQYRFSNIPVGMYKLTGRSTGFKVLTLQKVNVELNKTTALNLTLQVGEVSTAVEVSEATETIDTTTAQITATYDSRAAELMPTIENSNNGLFGVLNLSLLGSGVASNGGVGQGTG
ncbi:MAG: TonB-dependent receptor, partial [Acidobacteria bacterium]